MKVIKGKKRHDFIFKFARKFLSRYFVRKFNFLHDNIKIGKTPYIVVSNHLTNWDPILIGLCFDKNMYYVATDQILRMGLKSKILSYCFSPISRAKTTQETQTVITIFRRLKDNCNICIFAEGMTSFDGETGEIQPSIGKLVKRAGVTLATYRFTGSYFMFPRWARFIRKGKTEGRLVQTYSPEKIASMSENEIYETIKKDIYVNAYAEQEKNKTVYRGKKPAEYLETVLYCCPKCGQFGTLTSRGDILSCACGFKVRFNEYGYFETPDAYNQNEPPFKTITEWAKWQKMEMKNFAEKTKGFDGNTPLFIDENQELFKVERAVRSVLTAEGKLCLYKDRLSFIVTKGRDAGNTINFPFESIIEMSCFAMMRIIFYTNKSELFEINSKDPRSALKYLDLFTEINPKKE
jgi:1-acyl-sn-glycerol-3-phosphate acyltransferase